MQGRETRKPVAEPWITRHHRLITASSQLHHRFITASPSLHHRFIIVSSSCHHFQGHPASHTIDFT